MKIKFLGTCGAWRPAELFHNDGNLEKLINAKKLHLRSQLLINDDMLVDFPEDTYFKILEYGFDASAIESILITHSHSDHFYPADMSLRGGAYAHEMTVPEVNVYGDKKVYYVAGVNKICPDFNSALDRARNVASVKNAARFGLSTPCQIDGKCHDCRSPQRICNALIVHWAPMMGMEAEVVLIGEDMGF